MMSGIQSKIMRHIKEQGEKNLLSGNKAINKTRFKGDPGLGTVRWGF